MSEEFHIRALGLPEIRTLLDWAANEGWNPGIDDAAPFRAADPGGFFSGFVGERMVSGISAVRYGASFGFIGLYLCHPEFRGRGFGKAVWRAGVQHLAGRTIGLDGVDQQRENYERKGFRADYRTVRFGGRLATPKVTDSAVLAEVSPSLLYNLGIFDAACFLGPRPEFLSVWTAPPRRAVAVVRQGYVRGYGVIRECREGWKVGPLFADDELDARDLLFALAGNFEIFLDVPAPQASFIEQLGVLGLVPGFETTRMYLGEPPPMDLGKVFATTTLELG